MRLLFLFFSLFIFSICSWELSSPDGCHRTNANQPVCKNFDTKVDLENNENNPSSAKYLPNYHPEDSELFQSSGVDENLSKNDGPKITVDSNNEYRTKFQKISKNKNFLDSVRKLDDGTVQNNVTIKPKTKEEIEELSEFMKVLFPSVKTESEIMIDLFQSIQNNSASVAQQLDELSEILHDIDVAADFNRYHGYEFFMNKIRTTLEQALADPLQLSLLLQSQNLNLLCKCMHIFVPSAQNNEKVKAMLMKLDYSSFLLKTIGSIFEQKYVKVESFDPFIHKVISSMRIFVSTCPECSIDLFSNSHYNHAFQKLLSLPPDTKTWTSTVNMLKSLLKERDDILIEDDKEYVDQLKTMSQILDKRLTGDDSICQVFTTFVENYFVYHQTNKSTLNKQMNSLHSLVTFPKNSHNFKDVIDVVQILHDQLCVGMKSNEDVLAFLKLHSN